MNKEFLIKLIIILLIGFNAISFEELYQNDEAMMCYLEENSDYVLIEKNYLNSITSYLYKDNNDHYLGKIYKDSKKIEINDLIKNDQLNKFNNKVKELLSLKYPKFIVEGLINKDVEREYILRDNEMVIYFYNYQIIPSVNELLYLKINYNEVKDYLDFTFTLDKEYENESGYTYTNAKKSVAFTFDDSPNPGKTNQIVDILEDNLAHATFFVLGSRMKYNKDLILTIKERENEIGSHTYNHQNMAKMSDEDIINDFNLMNDLYKNITKENISLLRPPYGIIKDWQKNLVNVPIILWSLDTNDWKYRNKDYIVNYVLDHIKDGDIILFHDSYDETVRAIEELLPILYSKGYQVMSVKELFALKGLTLENNQIYHRAIK